VSDARILVEKANGIARMTLNRPEKHNALDMQFFDEFEPCLDGLNRDPAVRAIILTGAGRSFCSGVDLAGLADAAREPASVTVGGPSLSLPFGPLQGVPRSLRACRKPVIAAINGFASGMGMSLLCLCDHRIASEQASFAPGFIRMGLSGELGLTYLLPRLIGFTPALRFLTTSETRDARWAEKAGLVEEVVPAGNLVQAAEALAARLAEMPPLALGMIKELLYEGLNASFDAQVRSEAYAASLLLKTEDFQEAVRAWLEKRPPAFKGK